MTQTFGLLVVLLGVAANPTPSQALLDALNAVRASSKADLAKVQALPPPDRDAMMYWLSSHGRGALHARGVTDEKIGVPYYAIDYNIVAGTWPSTASISTGSASTSRWNSGSRCISGAMPRSCSIPTNSTFW